MDLGKKMEGSRNYHLSTKQVAKKFEFQTKSPIGCSCICSSGAAFRERQNRRGKGIPTEDLWFILVYPGRHAAVLRAHERGGNNQTYDTKKEVNFEHGNFFTTLEIINNKMPKPKFVQG